METSPVIPALLGSLRITISLDPGGQSFRLSMSLPGFSLGYDSFWLVSHRLWLGFTDSGFPLWSPPGPVSSLGERVEGQGGDPSDYFNKLEAKLAGSLLVVVSCARLNAASPEGSNLGSRSTGFTASPLPTSSP